LVLGNQNENTAELVMKKVFKGVANSKYFYSIK